MTLKMISILFLLFLSATLSLRIIPGKKVIFSSTTLNLFGSPDTNKNTSPAKKDNGGMFGGMGNIMESMKKAQEIAKQAQVVNKELSETFITGSDSSNTVTATYSGLAVPIGIKISDAAIAQGADFVSAAATQAMLDGHAKAQNVMMQKMTQLYASSGLPTPPTN